MNIYIQSSDGKVPFDDTPFKAMMGFREMGYDPILFTSLDELADAEPCDIVVGGVGIIERHLTRMGFEVPKVDYPVQLEPYLGRRVWRTTVEEIANDPSCWPVFVKPENNKQFVGKVVNGPADLVGCGTWGEITSAIASEPVEFLAEFRVFVRYGKILGISYYKGLLDTFYDYSVIKAAVDSFTDGFAGYALDFGITADGRTLLVEMNEGYALGSYGLEYHLYTVLLAARWAELTETEDACDFKLERFAWKEKQTPMRSL